VEAGGAPGIETATAELTKASHRLAESLYKNAAGASSTPSGSEGGSTSDGAGKADGDVIDAEVVDKK
jgi:hypothetical protein